MSPFDRKAYMKEYSKQWREENKEHIKQYKKQYHQENKEHIKQYWKQYRQKNKEYLKQYDKRVYRQANPEYIYNRRLCNNTLRGYDMKIKTHAKHLLKILGDDKIETSYSTY